MDASSKEASVNSSNSGHSPSQSSLKQGMGQLTCFELFLTLCPITCGIGLGLYAGVNYGWLYGIVGGILACGLGILLGIGFFRLFVALFGWWSNPFPNCRVCKLDDYEWLDTTSEGTFYVCLHCGAKYRLDKDGKRFMEILSDGSTCPYVQRKRIRGWKQNEILTNGFPD